jgi:MSHA biogenesis protein MshO
MTTTAANTRVDECSQGTRSGAHSGFTLVELVVALTIAAILVGLMSALISAPVDAYLDQVERAQLSDSSESVSRKLATDFRHALPNSVRLRQVGTRSIVEMLRVTDVSFYLAEGDTGLSSPQSDPELKVGATGAADWFEIYGRTTEAPEDFHLVIGHRGYRVAGADAYQMQDVIVLNPGAAYVQGKHRIELPPGFAFAAHDPHRRVFWVTEPVSYICNAASGVQTLRRFSGYSISADPPSSEQSTQLSSGGAVEELVASRISSCEMYCENAAGDVDVCEGTFVFDATITRHMPSGDEVIRIFQQFAMDNRT